MLASDFVNRIAKEMGRDPREIERYTRYLREAALFPERVGGRKAPITADAAANLLLAVLAADNATHAAEAAREYGALRSKSGVNVETLHGFLTRILERGHSDGVLRRSFGAATLTVFLGGYGAMLNPGRNDEKLFRPANLGARPKILFQSNIDGSLLLGLSFAIADKPEPQHLA